MSQAHDAVTPASLVRSRALQNAVVVWVVDEVATAQRIARAGVHAIVSNRPLEIMAWDRRVDELTRELGTETP
jgi:hypothetical protein